MKPWIRWALVIALAVLVGWWLHPSPPPAPLPPGTQVTVHDPNAILHDKPQEKPSIITKIVWKTSPPVIVARTDTFYRDTGSVRAYCTGEDTASHNKTLPPLSFKYDGRQLKFWSNMSDGRAFYQANNVKVPLQALTHDSTFEVRQLAGSIQALKKIERCLLGGAVGAAGGALIAQDWQKGVIGGSIVGCSVTFIP